MEPISIKIIKYTVCIVFAILILTPIMLAISGGFQSVGQLNDNPLGFPNPFQWRNYTKILSSDNFLRFFFNSFFITIFTVILNIFCAASTGFAFSKFNFKGKEAIYNYLLLGLLFPCTLAILPLYILLRDISLTNTYWGVILPQVAFSLPFNIMIFRGFFKEIPNELEDACLIDGYGKLGFFINIIIPLSRPAIATVAILTWVASWNNYFIPLIVLDDVEKFTLPMGSMFFIGQYAASWNMILAFFSITMVPAIIFFLFAQKYIVSGLTAGALKG